MERREGLLLLLVAGGWLAVARFLAVYGAPLLPRAIAGALTLHSFLCLVLVVATAIGLGAVRLVTARPREALGVARPAVRALAGAALWAPIVAALSAFIAFRLALPDLLAEIAQGGRRAVEVNTGAYGRALVQTHVLTTIAWAIVLTPVAEELLFRGALWSAVTALSRPGGAAEPSLPPELLREGAAVRALRAVVALARTGGLATLVTAAVFTWLHADQPGAAGRVRVVQVACLGLALGCARHATRSIWPGVLLHALFNAATLARARGWLPPDVWPHITTTVPGVEREISLPLPIPLLLWRLAALAAVLLVIAAVQRRIRARRERGEVPARTRA